MKVKLLEHYRDAQITLVQGDEQEVNDGLALWLIENRKAVAVVIPEPEPQPEQPQRLETLKRARGTK